jgi:ABC-type Fe3+ transport system permease subunit
VWVFFRLSSLELALILFAIVLGSAALGLVLGRYLRQRSEHLREPLGVLQGALLGLVGLVLAFGLVAPASQALHGYQHPALARDTELRQVAPGN